MNKFYFLICSLILLVLPNEQEGKAQDLTYLAQPPAIRNQVPAETLKEALLKLENKYNVSFLYKSKLLENQKLQNIAYVSNEDQHSLEEELNAILEPIGLTFVRIRDNFYLIEPKKTEVKNASEKPDERGKEDTQPQPEASNGNTTTLMPVGINNTPADIEVSGKIIDEESGEPLPGVNVLVKGTSIGTVSDIDGNYRINVPDGAQVLVFSFIGYLSKEVSLEGRSRVDVSLNADVQELEEVVVTALGFLENKDRMSATTSKVEGNQLVSSGETGVIDALSGKASGVRIARSSGDPGAGSHIQIRGQSTITGSQQPLIVLDGIPISNSTSTSTEGVYSQSRLNDINPDDIERIDILKGASAAALWGTRAAKGVINITTKQGARRDKLNISFRSTYSLDQINVRHPMQNKFGQGTDGVFSEGTTRSWGDKISEREGGQDLVNEAGPYFLSESGNLYYEIEQRNARETFTESNFDQVFQNGYFLDNSLSLSGGDEKNTFFLSLSDLKQEGVIRGNSDLRRTTLRLNAERRFNEIVKIQARSNYIRTAGNGIRKGNSSSGLNIGFLRNPPDFDISDYIGSYFAGPDASPVPNRQRSYRNPIGANTSPGFNNPLWSIYEQPHTNVVNRVISSAQIDVTPTPWLELIARGGVDNYWEKTNRYFPPNSASFQGGLFDEDIDLDIEFNMDVMARVKGDLGSNLSGTFLTGMNLNNRRFISLGGQIENFILRDLEEPLLDFSNGTIENSSLSDSESIIRTLGWYNQLNLAFWDMLFLDASARFETASTFGDESDPTFFFPSAGLAWQFTDLEGVESSLLSFGKLRASFGIVGIQPSSFQTVNNFISPNFSDPFGGNLDVALYGNGGFVPSSSLNNPRLRPERKEEFEVGTDLRFFKDKLSLGVTYYQNQTSDALFNISIASSSGYTSFYGNFGAIENKGWELDLNYNLVNADRFNWNIYANWNRNRNQVLDLAGIENIDIGGLGGISNRVVEGYQHGILWGSRWLRDDNGLQVLDENGFPMMDNTEGVIGDPNPDWRGGIGTSLSYKNFNLNILFETSQGGDMAAGTLGVLYAYGTHAHTAHEVSAEQDLLTVTGDVIPAGTTFRGSIRDFGAGPVALNEEWYDGRGGYFSGPAEQFVYDASWTKLREVSLSYSLQSRAFRELTRLQSVQFTLTGRNLMMWTDFVGIDPETNLGGPTSGRGIDYFNNPGTRSFLFTLRINY